jgi:uncharacterized protein HemX
VSAVYNKAIATTDTEMIANSVIVLFVMELDEWIFSDLEAINEEWTAHAAKSNDTSSDTVNEMKEEIALQKARIESQQEQIVDQQEQIAAQQEHIAAQQEELRTLRESVEKILRRVNSLECTV